MKEKFPGLNALFALQNVFSIICLIIGLFSTLDGLLGAGNGGFILFLGGCGFLVLALFLRLSIVVVKIFLEIEKNTRKE